MSKVLCYAVVNIDSGKVISYLKSNENPSLLDGGSSKVIQISNKVYKEIESFKDKDVKVVNGVVSEYKLNYYAETHIKNGKVFAYFKSDKKPNKVGSQSKVIQISSKVYKEIESFGDKNVKIVDGVVSEYSRYAVTHESLIMNAKNAINSLVDGIFSNSISQSARYTEKRRAAQIINGDISSSELDKKSAVNYLYQEAQIKKIDVDKLSTLILKRSEQFRVLASYIDSKIASLPLFITSDKDEKENTKAAENIIEEVLLFIKKKNYE